MKIVFVGEIGWNALTNCTLKDYTPEDPEDIFLEVEFEISVKGSQGSDRFRVQVYTPRGLLQNGRLRHFRCVSGQHMLIIDRYDYDLIIDTIKGWVRKASKLKDWNEVCDYLAQFAHCDCWPPLINMAKGAQ